MNIKDFVNPTVQNIPPSGIRKFFDIVGQMDDAISLGVGEPDFVTPWHITEAAIYSLEQGETHYTSNRGMPELCIAISKYMKQRFDLSYNPEDQLIVTVGASEGIDLAMRAMLHPGDEVLVPEPSYVSYSPCVSLAGGVAVGIKTSQELKFKITASAVEDAITPKTRAIILPYPNNPTGGIMTREDLVPIVEVLKKHDIIVVSDEIYSELTY
ncbi:MAG: aminotransferase class I/II-fold pyridoxal phosphate-dependent enzyme, partial [Clostridiales bacterium]|nr:aminotransferase class I/II-fold pyridoxal phosphate-dependent enzyme [Clostridiales bacterium]